jgi:hypothetical protein
MEQEKNQWHPGFTAAMQMELKDNREDLVFEEEHSLSKKPLQIDLLVIKNEKNVVLKNRIGKLFKRYNILEYKSPDDEMGVDTFYKVVAYACLYKAESDVENGHDAKDITITLIRHRKPVRLMQYLKQEGYELMEAYPGIYHISGKTMFDMQIIVSREVEEKEHVWLYSLQRDISWEAYYRLLMSIDELESKEKEEYGEAVLEVVSRANMEHIEKWKEAEEMCATLEKIMAPELEEKKQEGIWEGRQEGMIIAYAELGISVQNIAEKLSLSVETVEKIVEENAH